MPCATEDKDPRSASCWGSATATGTTAGLICLLHLRKFLSLRPKFSATYGWGGGEERVGQGLRSGGPGGARGSRSGAGPNAEEGG